MSSTFRASVTARLLTIRQRNICARGPASTIATARLELAQRHYRRTLQRQAEKDARRELTELSGKWWVGNMREMQRAGKPVWILGRLVSTPI